VGEEACGVPKGLELEVIGTGAREMDYDLCQGREGRSQEGSCLHGMSMYECSFLEEEPGLFLEDLCLTRQEQNALGEKIERFSGTLPVLEPLTT
jgi:hypothetical protein